MTKAEAVNWIINLSADMGKVQHQELWHYEQALSEIRDLLEDEDAVEVIHCEKCKHWKDSDGVYRRGFGAESKCPINLKSVFDGTFYCGMAERRQDG